jgi:hypothetical protein
VVRTPELTGTTEITRSRTSGDSTTGDVTTWVAGANGAVSGGAVTLAQAAVEQWATPLCITPTVVNATEVTVNIVYTVWLYTSVGETAAAIRARIADDLGRALRTRPIGGDVIGADPGRLYKTFLEATIKASFPDHTFRVSVATPAVDLDLAQNEVCALGTVTGTVNLEPTP